MSPYDTRACFWYSLRGNEDLSVLPQTILLASRSVNGGSLVCQIIEIHQWESEKLGESRSTDCNDPVYRGHGDSPRWYFQQQDLMEGREREKREEICFCLAYVYCMIIDSYEHETQNKNSRHVVSTKIKRVLSASRYHRAIATR